MVSARCAMTGTAARAAAKTLRERHWTGLCACASLLERSTMRGACQFVTCGETSGAREKTSGSARWAAPATSTGRPWGHRMRSDACGHQAGQKRCLHPRGVRPGWQWRLLAHSRQYGQRHIVMSAGTLAMHAAAQHTRRTCLRLAAGHLIAAHVMADVKQQGPIFIAQRCKPC